MEHHAQKSYCNNIGTENIHFEHNTKNTSHLYDLIYYVYVYSMGKGEA